MVHFLVFKTFVSFLILSTFIRTRLPMISIPGLGWCLGGGHGNSLQYSSLENPMIRGAWQATVLGVAKEPDRTEWLNNNEHVSLAMQGTTAEMVLPPTSPVLSSGSRLSPWHPAHLLLPHDFLPANCEPSCVWHTPSSAIFLYVDRASQLPMKIHDAPALIELLLRNS